MGRRIPGRGMPHRAVVEPCTGYGSDGPVFGPARLAVRANYNGGGASAREITVGATGFTAVRTGRVVLDDVDLPLLSRITNEATGNSALVGVVERWDQPPLQPFLVVTLAQLIA